MSEAGEDQSVSIAGASRLTGLSKKAIRSRVHRGSIPSSKAQDGTIRIAVEDLRAEGLLDRTEPDVGSVSAAELLDRLIEAERRVGEAKQLEERASSLEKKNREQEDTIATLREEVAILRVQVESKRPGLLSRLRGSKD